MYQDAHPPLCFLFSSPSMNVSTLNHTYLMSAFRTTSPPSLQCFPTTSPKAAATNVVDGLRVGLGPTPALERASSVQLQVAAQKKLFRRSALRSVDTGRGFQHASTALSVQLLFAHFQPFCSSGMGHEGISGRITPTPPSQPHTGGGPAGPTRAGSTPGIFRTHPHSFGSDPGPAAIDSATYPAPKISGHEHQNTTDQDRHLAIPSLVPPPPLLSSCPKRTAQNRACLRGHVSPACCPG